MFSVSMYVFFVIKDECFFDFRLEIKIVEKWCCILNVLRLRVS